MSFSYPSAEVIEVNNCSARVAIRMPSSVTIREAPARVRTVWGSNLNAFVSGLAQRLHGFQYSPVACRRALDRGVFMDTHQPS